MYWLMAIVASLFSSFVFLDVLSIVPRISGSITKNNGLGYSFEVMLISVKRVFIVLYPPVLGFIALKGSLLDMLITIFASYALAAVACFIAVVSRKYAVQYFCETITNYSSGVTLWRSFFYAFKHNKVNWKNIVSEKLSNKPKTKRKLIEKIHLKIYIPALWIYFYYSSAFFVINILGIVYKDYSAIILQLTGLINAIGTLALSFYLDPMLSRIYEKSSDLPTTMNSLIAAHITNICIVSPLFFWMLYVLLKP